MVTKAELLVTNKELEENYNDSLAAMSRMSHELADAKKETTNVREYNTITLGNIKFLDGQLKICQAVMRKANLLPALDEEHSRIDLDVNATGMSGEELLKQSLRRA